MLSGNWKNFDELEESLSYPEVYIIVQAMRAQERRMMKFQAALQGVDIDKEKQEEDPVEKIKRRVRAKQQGIDEETLRFRESVTAAGFEVIQQ